MSFLIALPRRRFTNIALARGVVNSSAAPLASPPKTRTSWTEPKVRPQRLPLARR